MKIPSSIGAAIDRMYELRQKRYALMNEAKKVGEEENAIEEHLFKKYRNDDIKAARGSKALASVVTQDVPNIEDFDRVVQYAIKTKSFDLFQKRLSSEACKARWEQGINIPGVEKFTKVRLSLNAVKSKKSAVRKHSKVRS